MQSHVQINIPSPIERTAVNLASTCSNRAKNKIMEPITQIAKYRAGEAVYSIKNQNYVCQIISIKARYIDNVFLTWAYELDYPDLKTTQWVTENKISKTKDKKY